MLAYHNSRIGNPNVKPIHMAMFPQRVRLSSFVK